MKERVLVLAPIGRDAQAASRNLADVQVESVICADVADLVLKLGEGAAAALVTEESFFHGGILPLEGATQAAKRGAELTGQLLAFSRTQRLRTESIDLNGTVMAMEDLLFTTIGATVRIETVLQKDLWPAIADPSQIESVILNLAVNARDAMPDGGRLTISTANVPAENRKKPMELAAGDYVRQHSIPSNT